MKTDFTRRDIFRFGAGAAAGVMLTPAPWKTIDDLAIWTQNWKWIPTPPKGPVSMRTTTCSLCPAGCTLRTRCIGGQPVSMQPAASGQALCPLGLTGHHLAYHPSRLKSPARVTRTSGAPRQIPISFNSVVAAMKTAIAERKGAIAVLDTRPGRAASDGWRAWIAALPDGRYVPAPGRPGAHAETLATMLHARRGTLGLDASRARTVVSFGAPLAEGFGDPRLTRRLLAAGRDLRLIHIDPLRSATAAIADRWLPLLPGTEASLALGFAHVLIAENRIDAMVRSRIADFDEYASLAAGFTPDAVSRATRIPAETIVRTAREIVDRRPAMILAGEDPGGGSYGRVAETAITGLNLLLAGPENGCIAHREPLPSPFDDATLAEPVELTQVADHSIALLVVDASEGEASVPWSVIEKKLIAHDPLVVALAPFFNGFATHASYVIPTPTFLEATHEVPTPFDSRTASLAIAHALVAPRHRMHDPLDIVRALGVTTPSSDDLLRQRVAKIHASAVGTLLAEDGSTQPLSELASEDDLRNQLLAGARWNSTVGETKNQESWSLLEPAREGLLQLTVDGDRIVESRRPLVLLTRGTRDVTASAALSPVITKLYQESGLRRGAATVAINPKTARDCSVRSGAKVRIETARGAALATVTLDESVMPGIIAASVGPSPHTLGIGEERGPSLLDILPAGDTWRATAASLVEA